MTQKNFFYTKLSILIFLAFSLLILAVVLNKKIHIKINELEKLAFEVASQAKKIKEAAETKESLKSLLFDKKDIEKIFVDLKEIVSFIESIERLADSFNIAPSLEVLEDHRAHAQNADTMTFKIDVKGDFLQIVRFLHALENMDVVVGIENISFQKEKEKSDIAAQLNFTINLIK